MHLPDDPGVALDHLLSGCDGLESAINLVLCLHNGNVG
jgi:hypothetical protein